MRLLIMCLCLINCTPILASKETHGGSGIRCAGIDGSTTQVEVLDFWEGKELPPQLTIKEKSEPPIKQAERAISRLVALDSKYFETAPQELQSIFQKWHFTEKVLVPVNDVFPAILPKYKHCKIVQVAIYLGTASVLVNQDHWDHMSSTQRAGLLVHETVFKIIRDHELTRDSRKARLITAAIFSELPDEALRQYYEQTLSATSPPLFTNPIRVFEHVLGSYVIGESVEEAYRAHKSRCELWKKQMSETQKRHLKDLSCGRPILDPIKVKLGSDKEFAIGYEVSSKARALGELPDHLNLIEFSGEQIWTGGTTFCVTQKQLELAWKEERNNYHARCRKWGKNLKEKFKHQLFRAVCQDPRFPIQTELLKTGKPCDGGEEYRLSFWSEHASLYLISRRTKKTLHQLATKRGVTLRHLIEEELSQ